MNDTVEIRALLNQRLYFTNNLAGEDARVARASLSNDLRHAHEELQSARQQAIETINNTLRELGVTLPKG